MLALANLSLALASVMLLGMMVVGTSASYPDVTYENNEEAIEVLKAVGVMTGDEKGNFNPDKAVTRNEMAVIMTALLDLKTKDYAGSCPLTDVPAWAEPYVAACYANGIVSGTSATTYSGDATVTDDGDVLYAFVDNKNGNVEATGYIAVMLDNKAVVTEDDDDTYYEYTVAIDGEETTITTNDTTANTALADLAKGTVFSYNLDGEYVVDVNDAATGITLYTKYVSAANSDYIVVRDGMTLDADGNATYSGASKQYNIGGETVYTITMEYKKDGTTLDTVSVSEGGSYAKKDKVIFTLDDNDLDVVFVIDEIK